MCDVRQRQEFSGGDVGYQFRVRGNKRPSLVVVVVVVVVVVA